MFERFSREARAAVEGAERVARECGSRGIDTRHLLLALVEEDEATGEALRGAGADVDGLAAAVRAELRAGGLDGEALAAVGIDLEAVRSQADKTFGEGALERAGRRHGGRTSFTPDAKKALELGLREAIRTKQKSIHGGHLLLGILRAESPGRALLVRAGVDPDALRLRLEEQLKAA